jgi:hypothetical protein
MHTALMIWVMLFLLITLVLILTKNVEGIGCLGLMFLLLPVFLLFGAVFSADWGHCAHGYDTSTYQKC